MRLRGVGPGLFPGRVPCLAFIVRKTSIPPDGRGQAPALQKGRLPIHYQMQLLNTISALSL
jgi:hypothetical protein